ncbi:hypothetical protein FVA74_08270 [Salinibacterium sp. dk2585]|uniref:hypothetical protein n=1 Tax=unclassified Salinibacterium TaxID=2632331 RepID=UPI0011C24321|nr:MULTISPECIES: hypothetical protein [unclassified Salinibacterium]QEE61573.1 hypothetical protein FVA74_08270 [Salinibacterium sp. dk2585]TXK52458.1 hypothetical protein FVP63_12820 [Salinibacterium sp. dk5596]
MNDASGRAARLIRPRTTIAIALALILAMGSTVSFAAWRATTTASSAASNGTITLASSGIPNLAHTYTSVESSKIVPVTLSNSGSVALPLTSVAIATTGALPAANVTLTVWARSGSTCPASIPAAPTVKASASLSASILSLPAGLGTVPAAGSVVLCVATTLTGTLGEVAGLSLTPTLTFSGRVGDNWTATDPSTTRSFTQNVAGLAAPRIVDCINGTRWTLLYTYDTARIVWTAVPGATSYRLYRNGAAIGSAITGTEFTANGSTAVITQGGTITVRAFAGSVQSEPSNPLTVTTYDPIGFVPGNDVRCGAIG